MAEEETGRRIKPADRMKKILEESLKKKKKKKKKRKKQRKYCGEGEQRGWRWSWSVPQKEWGE